ncbi:MAG TPA: hypothetical protein VLQ45_07800 [Thermoanaerobaculia bacterium]|nr:hypothetical protein [Thermoanaerobaculia bacterium]
MKTFATVLVLLTVFALVPGAPCTAETPPAAAPSVAPVADFLATLSGGPSDAPGNELLPPSPTFLSTTCTSHSQCPTGQLCCYPCGIDGCDWVCMTVVRNRCPFFP